MPRGWPAMAIATLAVIAILGGLLLIGGPEQARKERRDQQRHADLAAMTGLVRCLADRNGGQLPQTLAAEPDCNGQIRMTDPGGGAPYRYQVTGPDSYQLCADFELPQERRIGWMDRDADGCVRREYRPANRVPGRAGAAPAYGD